MSFRRVANKKRKKSNNLARIYYMHTKYFKFLSTEYNHRGNFFPTRKSSDWSKGKCLNLPLSSLNGKGASFFYRGGGNYNPQILQCIFFSETCTCSTIGLADSFEYPTEELDNCRFRDVDICPALMEYAKNLFS